MVYQSCFIAGALMNCVVYLFIQVSRIALTAQSSRRYLRECVCCFADEWMAMRKRLLGWLLLMEDHPEHDSRIKCQPLEWW